MPNLVGKTEAEAKEELTNLHVTQEQGFTINVENEYSDQVAAGQVLKTDPEHDIEIDRNGTVTIFVSSGQEPVEVPAVVGMTKEAATSRLTDAGFRVNVTEEDSNQTQNIVFRQNPEGGGKVEPGSTITIVIPTPLFAVPNVVGSTREAATNTLREAGFQVEVVEEDSNENQNIVFRQTPEANNQVKADSKITIFVPTPLYQVPNVVGSTRQSAVNTLEAAGFEVEVVERESTATVNTVLSQSPQAGSQQKKDTKIVIEVAISQQIRMPNVVGLLYGAAQSQLQSLGFVVNQSNCHQDYTVEAQSLENGSMYDTGTNVTLTCSIPNTSNPDNPDQNSND
jgi:serine/threonine-protein kinase